MKLSALVIFMVIYSNNLVAQKLEDNKKKIIVEGIMPQNYDKKSVEFKYMTIAVGRIGYRYEEIQKSALNVVNGFVKWEHNSNEPLIVRSPLFGRPSYIGSIVEPGDSISFRFEKNGDIIYSGVGSEKFQLKCFLEKIDDSLENLETYKTLSDKNSPPPSVDDYLLLNDLLNKKLSIMLSLIESYKSKLSSNSYIEIKDKVISNIEKRRIEKFHMLRGKIQLHTNTESKKIVNQLGLTNEDLIAIYDSTMNGPAAQWLEHGDSHITEVYYLYFKTILDAYREKREFLKMVETAPSVLGENADYWVQLYNLGKKKYTGMTREAFLAYLFWNVRGSIYRCGFPPGIESILKNYYEESRYPVYKEVVRQVELKYRERFNRKYASDFVLTDTKDQIFAKEILKGKIAILDFWFTGCTGCVQMVPALHKVEEYFQKDTNVIFLNISIDKNKQQWLKSLAQKKYTTGNGKSLYTGGQGSDHEMIKKYGVTGYPTLYLIDGFDRVFWADKIPDPRKDNGKKLIELIKKQLALIKDGPYVFHKDQYITTYSIDGSAIKNDNYEKNEIPLLKSNTDQIDQTFGISLKQSLQIEPSEYSRTEKMLVLSDIEGNFDAFKRLLQSNKIIDEKFNWTFGNGHLIFAGDMFDRGLQVTECLWLIYSLEEKAKIKGGYVHFILGNHEIMNLQGYDNYVQQKYKNNAVLIGKTLTELYADNSEIGRWLRTKNIIEKIGDILFTHGGVSRKINQTSLTIAEINRLARPYYAKANKDYGDEIVNTIMSTSTGPFWYRGYYQGTVPEALIDSTLKKFDVKCIVTGHTIVADTISVYYGGKVINTDTDHAEGKSEALLIEGNKSYRVNAEGERKLLFANLVKNPNSILIKQKD